MSARRNTVSIVGGAVAVMMLAMAPDAMAQQPAVPPVPPTPEQAQETEIPAEELESFAEAYIEVQEIGATHQDALAGATTPEEAQALQEQATQEMTEALTSHGYTPDEYSEIVTVINSDEQLLMLFSMILDERGFGDGAGSD